ncbi:MAG: CBS domain-containing protein [Promethearchaeota archaeon]
MNEEEEEEERIEPLAIDMTSDLVICTPEENLCKVAELMISHGIDSVIVAEGNKPVGIVTSETMCALISEGKNPCEVIAKDVMASPLSSVFSSDRIRDIATHFAKTNVNRLGVVDDDGKLIGIISKKQYDQFRDCVLSIRKRQ